MCSRWKPGRALSVLRGKLCICSNPRHLLFIKQQYKNSTGQPFSAAEAALSPTLQVFYGLYGPKSMPRARPNADTPFHQYVYFGLDPNPLCSATLFLCRLIQGQDLFFFFFLPKHRILISAAVQREPTQRFSNAEERFAFYRSQKVHFHLHVQVALCYFYPLVASSIHLT